MRDRPEQEERRGVPPHARPLRRPCPQGRDAIAPRAGRTGADRERSGGIRAWAKEHGIAVYVNDNTAGTNTIGAFDRHADGTLTPEAGSPFAAGGAGTGAGLASQGALQISPDGRFLIAADAGSNQISALRIRGSSSLKLVHDGVVSSGGVLPVSVAIHGDLVYVANSGNGGSNYTGFRLRPNGRLEPVAGSAVALPDGSQPGDVLFNGDGTKLAGTRVGTSQIDSFTVGSGGLLTAAPGSPFPAQGLGPFGSQFRPTNPDQLFVSNAHDAGTGTVSAFADAADGTLSSIGASPFADLQTAPCGVEISHDGQFLFTVNTGSGTISRYSIAPGGALTLPAARWSARPAASAPSMPGSAPTAAPCTSTRAGSAPSARSPSTAAT